MQTDIDRRAAAAAPETTDDGVERLARVLEEADLDCACRETLRAAIENFRRFEALRRERRSLEVAAQSRREILRFLVYLEDLDRIVAPDFDPEVCAETAQVFDDIAEAARRGARSLRALGARQEA